MQAQKPFWTHNRKMAVYLAGALVVLAAIWVPQYVPQEGDLVTYGKPLLKGLSASLKDGYLAADGVFVGTLIKGWVNMDKPTREAEVESIIKKLAEKNVKSAFLYSHDGKLMAQAISGKLLYIY
jgi:hypothetical protein